MGKRKEKQDPTAEYVAYICSLYGDTYDDRDEDSRPGGEDWIPGEKALHLSLSAFQKELEEQGISLSTAKIRKILITGGCWSTKRSRDVAELYEKYQSISRVAAELGVTDALVTMYLPYGKAVYDLEEKSGNARRIERWREKKSVNGRAVSAVSYSADHHATDHSAAVTHTSRKVMDASDTRPTRPARPAREVALSDLKRNGGSLSLWKCICLFQDEPFTTSGRGSKPGILFTYRVSEPGSSGGRHYDGPSVEGFGNELWITTLSSGEQKKSISRSTVDLAYKNALELMKNEGYVNGPKALGIPGAGSYLYPMFVRFGVIKKSAAEG